MARSLRHRSSTPRARRQRENPSQALTRSIRTDHPPALARSIRTDRPPARSPSIPAAPRSRPPACRAGSTLCSIGIAARFRSSISALVDRESNSEPKQRTGSAIGLMQIIPVVLDDYNTRNGTHYKPKHLVDPAINVAIRCDSSSSSSLVTPGIRMFRTCRRTGATFGCRRAPHVRLERGVLRSGRRRPRAALSRDHGITDLTIDRVSQAASAAGASKHLPTRPK